MPGLDGIRRNRPATLSSERLPMSSTPPIPVNDDLFACRQLKAGIALKATVIRDGKESQIEARDLVPGDIVVLEEGVTIPADSNVSRRVSLWTALQILDTETPTSRSSPTTRIRMDPRAR